MKLHTLALMAAGLLGSLAAEAAQVDIYLTGSTAFRADVYATIRSMYDGGAPTQTPGSSSSSSVITWSGTMTSLFGAANTVVIHAFYSGSVDGTQKVTQNVTQPFLANATDTATIVNHTSDFAFADNFQANTTYTSPTLSDTVIGVVTFTWARSVQTPASVNNMTPVLARSLFPVGSQSLGLFDGSSDMTTPVYLVGRDNGSGTYVNTLSETGYGVFTAVSQNMLSPGADGTTGTSFVPYTLVNSDGFSGGFASGGSVAKVLSQNTVSSYAVGYLGISDALNINGTGNGAPFFMKYNGVAFSKAAVQNGQYSFWSYEHLLSRSPLTANQTTFLGSASTSGSFLNKVDAQLVSNVTGSGIALSTMLVSKPIEGGPINPQ